MPDEELKCTKLVERDNGRDEQGKRLTWHEKCGLPASEVEVGGLLTKAKAVLCERHRIAADREAFLSQNGFPKGKVKKPEKDKGYNQTRLPDTGVL